MENAPAPNRPTPAARPTADGQSDGKPPEKEPSFSEVLGELVLLDSPKTLIFPVLFALTFWLMKRTSMIRRGFGLSSGSRQSEPASASITCGKSCDPCMACRRSESGCWDV